MPAIRPLSAAELFAALGDPAPLLHTLAPEGSRLRSSRIVARDLDDWIEEHAAANCYFAVNATPKGFARKAKKTDIVALRACAWADIDPTPDEQPAEAAERFKALAKALLRSQLPPSAIIFTGRGLQALWLSNVMIRPNGADEFAQAEALNARVAEALGGDATGNVDRIFRLPDSTNVLSPKKLAAGWEPKLVQAVATLGDDGEIVRYSPDDVAILHEVLAQDAEVQKHVRAKAPAAKSSETKTTADNSRVQELIAQLLDTGVFAEEARPQEYQAALAVALTEDELSSGLGVSLKARWHGDTTGLHDTSRSGLDLSVGAILVRRGWAPEDVARALLDCPSCSIADGAKFTTDWLRARAVARIVAIAEADAAAEAANTDQGPQAQAEASALQEVEVDAELQERITLARHGAFCRVVAKMGIPTEDAINRVAKLLAARDYDYHLRRDALAKKLKLPVATLDRARKEGAKAADAAAAKIGAAAAAKVNPSPLASFDFLQERYFVASWPKNAAIIYEEKPGILDRIEEQAFRLKFKNKLIPLGADRFTTLADYWLSHPQRREYDRVVFEPGPVGAPPVPTTIYNLWQGFAVKPRRGNWSKMRRHLFAVLCSRDKQAFRYLLKLFAFRVQNPHRKVEVALAMRSDVEGAGKGVVARWLLRIVGQHGMSVSQKRHITGNFNRHLEHLLVLYSDEATWAGDHDASNALKSLITEKTLPIEPKGVDPYDVPNRMFLMMSTNAQWAVPAGEGARRYFVLDVSNERAQDFDYFAALERQAKQEGGIEAMLDFLLRLDISTWNHRDLVRTKALRVQQILSMDSVHKWIYAAADNDTSTPYSSGRSGLHIPLGGWVSHDILRADYEDYCKANRLHVESDTAWGRELTKLCGPRTRKSGAVVPGTPTIYKWGRTMPTASQLMQKIGARLF